MRIKCLILLSAQKDRYCMVITLLLKTGEGKEICDDSILINDQIFSSDKLVACREYRPMYIAIADGVGGNAGGHDASDFLLRYIKRNKELIYNREEILNFLYTANKELIAFASKTPDKTSMATTFTGIFLLNDHIYVAHVGNTRLYVFQGNYLKQITVDHTTYKWLMMHGNYQEAEECNKSEIISCFGGGSNDLLRLLTVESPFEDYKPEAFVLTSDGIHDYVDIDTFEQIFAEDTTMEARLEKLWKTAKERGSTDDCSIIVIEK